MENDNEAHSAPVKIEALDEALSESQAAPPSSQLAPESGCGNLDLPPSPPPLPLVAEIHEELSMEMAPPVHQITNEPPLKKRRNMHQKPDQSIEACKIEVETVPLVSGTAEIVTHGEEQMEAQKMEGEVSDRSPAEMAPQESIPRNLETHASSGSDTIVSTGQRETTTQDTPSGAGDTVAASAQGDFCHIQGPRRQGQTNVKNKRPNSKALSRKIHQKRVKKTLCLMDDERSLLRLETEHHKSSRVSLESDFELRIGSHQVRIPYQYHMEDALVRLGLYQMRNLHQCPIDKGLITALVERWRPETNTFHLPVGECTVTLEDVSCLWGLSVKGLPISGESDADWSAMVLDCLGVQPEQVYKHANDCPWTYKWIDKGEPNARIQCSRFHLQLKWLRHNFSRQLTPNDDQETIDRFTRAYCMDLLGSVMFPDASANGVPAMYLQFLENLAPQHDYNWGGAVLAHLYRELTRACRAKEKSINGPLLLLQMWSWTRFAIGRPKPNHDILPFGGPDLWRRNAFGVKWVKPHIWEGNPHRGTSQYRGQFSQLTPDVVNWRPYEAYYQNLPARGHRDIPMWCCRVYCTHFWIVEFHHPDRVMRQYGLFQTVPPPDPLPWDHLKELRTCTHMSGVHLDGTLTDWRNVHKEYINANAIPVVEQRPYDPSRHYMYIAWFFHNGMPTVHSRENDAARLSQPVPAPEGDVAELAYVPHDQQHARVMFRHMRLTARGIKMVQTPGQKAYGKQLLKVCRDTLGDVGLVELYRAMVDKEGLPFDPDKIDISGDIPDQHPIEPKVHIPQASWDNVVSGNYNNLTQILVDRINLGNVLSSSAAVTPLRNVPRRKHNV